MRDSRASPRIHPPNASTAIILALIFLMLHAFLFLLLQLSFSPLTSLENPLPLSIESLKFSLEQNPSNVTALALLGIAYSHAGRASDSGPVLEKAVSSNKQDWVSLSYLAKSYEYLARKLVTIQKKNEYLKVLHVASTYYLRAIRTREAWISNSSNTDIYYPQQDYSLPIQALYRGLGDTFAWSGKFQESREAFEHGYRLEGMQWPSPFCRPLFPASKMPVYDLETNQTVSFFVQSSHQPMLHQLLVDLEAHLDVIRDEFFTLRSQITNFTVESAGLHDTKQWTVFPLFINGHEQSRECSFVSKTCDFLKQYSLVTSVQDGQVKFSVMLPGTYVKPHAGPSNSRLRVHCTLRTFNEGPKAAALRVGTDVRHWNVDSSPCFVFDESCEHEVVTIGSKPMFNTTFSRSLLNRMVPASDDLLHPDNIRAVLIVDIKNPFVDDGFQNSFSKRTTTKSPDRREMIHY
jgi:Aspartyl/Asparaginyl beta-hydroxylase